MAEQVRGGLPRARSSRIGIRYGWHILRGLIPGSRLVDASPHKIDWKQTIEICKSYEFLVLYTSTVGFYSDLKLIRKIKEENPGLKIAFVGPHGHIKPEETLNSSADIDFVVRGEFDHSVAEFAHGQTAGKQLPALASAKTARS